jgi:hypothetical protein
MAEQAFSRPAWWLDPTRLLLLCALPLLLFIMVEGPASLRFYRNFVNNYDDHTVSVGLASLLALACGAAVAKLLPTPRTGSPIDPGRATIALRALGFVAIAAYGLWMGPWLLHPELIVEMLGGSGSGPLREELNGVSGVTSLLHVSVVFGALLSAVRLDPMFRVPADLRLMLGILATCTLAQAILGSERLALIEFAVPLVLARIAFRWRPSFVRAALPVLAVVGVFLLFAGGEYFRSWQFYRDQGVGSFWEFSLTRFAGYYATAVNNGMGVYHVYSPLNVPHFTASWFYRFPLWGWLGLDIGNADLGEELYYVYLLEIGNLEFNNLSGLYAPMIDYGVGLGLLFMAATGCFIGMMFRSFSRRRPTGLILYPTCYVAMLEIIRLSYLGDQRVFPVFLAAAGAIWFVRKRPRPARLPGFSLVAPRPHNNEPIPAQQS